jgi:MFS family permease
MLSVLAERTYRRLFAAQILSLVGTGLSTVALALLAYELAGADAGLVLGTALALKMLAYVGLAPVAGALAARLPRRPFLVTLDLVRAAMVLVLPFVTQVWQVYASCFFSRPARGDHADLPGNHSRRSAGRAGLCAGAVAVTARL